MKNKRALNWWNKLTPSQKRNFEFKTYGHGDCFEDNTLSENDIVHMHKLFNTKEKK